MQSSINVTLTVATGGKVLTFPLGASHLESIVGGFGSDSPELVELYVIASQHPSYSVRRSVVNRDCLPADAALAMANDPCASVRTQLARTEVFRQVASEEMVLQLIASDPEVAEAVAGYVERYENVDVNVLCDALFKHPDPVVRSALASNSGTPVRWVRKLVNDPMPDVAAVAAHEIKNRRC